MPQPVTGRSQLIEAASPSQIADVRELFLEYARSLSFNLCFQSFDEELKGLPAGCVALHKLEEKACEMKRLYVRPEARGHGYGRVLVEHLISEAREIGYERMRLDTIGSEMKKAIELYRELGFKEIAPYRANPIEGALYMELAL